MKSLQPHQLIIGPALRLLAVLSFCISACVCSSAYAEGLLRLTDCRIVDDNGPVKAMGVNYVDGFWNYAKNGNRDAYLPALDALAAAKVPFIRMSLGPWALNRVDGPADPAIVNFVENRELYFSRLDTFLADAKARHIGVVLDIFWSVDPYVAYFHEPASVWARPQSRTFGFLREVVAEFARRHGNDPEIWMVEFLNEGNLNIDFPRAVHARSELATLINGLSVALRASGDKHLVDTGNSLPRPAAENLNRHAGWMADSSDDFLRALAGETPVGAAVASVHIYPDQKRERTWDNGDILGALPLFNAFTRNTCHPVFIGEFGATNLMADEAFIDRVGRSDIQLSALWGYGRFAKDPYAFGMDANGKVLLMRIGRFARP